MRNKDLFNDEKDLEIARLKYTIKKFKEYDEERKEFYKKKMRRLGELESYIEELKDTTEEDEVGKLKAKIARQKEELKRLNILVQYKEIIESGTVITPEDVVNIDSLKKRISAQDKIIKNLRSTMKELLVRKKSEN